MYLALKLKFSVCGKDTKGVVSGSWVERWVEKYDIFFFNDLSAFLKSINAFPRNNDSIEIPEGDFAIPFHFSIPHNA